MAPSVAKIPITLDLSKGYTVEESVEIIARQTDTRIRITGHLIEALPKAPPAP